MRLKMTLLFVFAIVLSVNSQSKKQLLDKALVCWSKDDYESAEQLIKKAIEISANDSEDLYLLYSNLGSVQRKNNKKKAALESYDIAHKLKPNSVLVLNNRASLRTLLTDYQGALDDYAHSLAIDSLYEDTYVNRSHLYKVMCDTISAIRDLQSLLRINPKSLPARNNMADVQMARGQLTEAMATFTTLLEENPNEPILIINIAEIYLKMKDFDKSMQTINKAIKIKGSYAGAYLTRGEIFMKLGDQKRAKKDFQMAIKLKCDDNRVYELLDRCN